MISAWRRTTLGEVCELRYGKALKDADRSGSGSPVYGSNGIVGYHDRAITAGPTIVVGRKGSYGEVNVSNVACWPIDTTYYIDSSCTQADLKWLGHRIANLGLNRMNRAAAVPGLNREDAYRLELLLPPIEEQRRIAAVLDKAEDVRAKRRASVDSLGMLSQALFSDMFGSCRNTVNLGDLVSSPLRNGTSPSSVGTVAGRVLTLSAVTGARFDEAAQKQAMFQTDPIVDRSVRADEFLICRGNGNRDLVGRGRFPLRDLPNVAFPDTMIAARVPDSRMRRRFFEAAWSQPDVRAQVAAVARTTNGTFKVNQSSLESIRVLCPPLVEQSRFEDTMDAIGTWAESAASSACLLDEVWKSLQYSMFSGEL